MTNATLRGKPDAGNPHVRFDEGEVASAKPRRGSLLYKTVMTKLVTLMALTAGCLGALTASAAKSAKAIEYSDGRMVYYYDDVDHSADVNFVKQWSVRSSSAAKEPTKKITTIVIDPSFAGTQPQYMEGYFRGLKDATAIQGLEYLDTSKATTMAHMFHGCAALTHLELPSFKTEKVTNMTQMFIGCSLLGTLDLTSFSSAVLSNTQYMFQNCSALTTIYTTSGFDLTGVKTTTATFNGCNLLAGDRGTTLSTQGDLSGACGRLDGGTDAPGYFSRAHRTLTVDSSTFGAKHVASVAAVTNGVSIAPVSGTSFSIEYRMPVSVVYTPAAGYDFDGLATYTDSRYATDGLTVDATLSGDDIPTATLIPQDVTLTVDTSAFAAKNVQGVFVKMTADGSVVPPTAGGTFSIRAGAGFMIVYQAIDGRYFLVENNPDKGKILDSFSANAAYAETGIAAATTVTTCPEAAETLSGTTVRGVVTTNDTATLAFYFTSDTPVGTVYLRKSPTGFPTWNGLATVTNVVVDASMSNYGVDGQGGFQYFFYNLSNVTHIAGLNHLDTSKATTLYQMFKGCSALTSLDLSSFRTENVTAMGDIFNGCSSLTELDLSTFSTNKLTGCGNMFRGCSVLTTIYAVDTFDLAGATNSTYVFWATPKLVGGNGTKFLSSNSGPGYGHIDVAVNPGYFTLKTQALTIDSSGFAAKHIASVVVTCGGAVVEPVEGVYTVAKGKGVVIMYTAANGFLFATGATYVDATYAETGVPGDIAISGEAVPTGTTQWTLTVDTSDFATRHIASAALVTSAGATMEPISTNPNVYPVAEGVAFDVVFTADNGYCFKDIGRHQTIPYAEGIVQNETFDTCRIAETVEVEASYTIRYYDGKDNHFALRDEAYPYSETESFALYDASSMAPVPNNSSYARFVGWCQKQDRSDEPITSLPPLTLGDKKLYAKYEIGMTDWMLAQSKDLTVATNWTGSVIAHASSERVTAGQSYEVTMPYRIHLPATFEPGKKYPLVLHLHGAGSRGYQGQQMGAGIKEVLDYMRRQGVEAITLSPQVPKNGDDFGPAGYKASDFVSAKMLEVAPGGEKQPYGPTWVDTQWNAKTCEPMAAVPTVWFQAATNILFETIANAAYQVDTDRIYVIGMSMGGYGTWEMLSRFPSLFAAGAPCCGGMDTAQAASIKDVPVWAFHGSGDTTVSPVRSQDAVAALKSAGGSPRYREYGDNYTLNEGICKTHNCWSVTYSDDNVMDWLFAQHRDRVANTVTWTGATDGNWSTASNWSPRAPQAGDDVVIDAVASVALTAATPRYRSVTIGATKDVTLTMSGAGTSLWADSVTVGAQATVTCEPLSRVFVKGYELNVATNGLIDVSGKGPVTDFADGGVIAFELTGPLTVAGSILANGAAATGSGLAADVSAAGTGGSIEAEVGEIVAAGGVIAANGGDATDPHADSGTGRIGDGGSIVLNYQTHIQSGFLPNADFPLTLETEHGFYRWTEGGDEKVLSCVELDKYGTAADLGTIWMPDTKILDGGFGRGINGEVRTFDGYDNHAGQAYDPFKTGHARLAGVGTVKFLSLRVAQGARLEIGGGEKKSYAGGVRQRCDEMPVITMFRPHNNTVTVDQGARLDLYAPKTQAAADAAVFGTTGTTFTVNGTLRLWSDPETGVAPKILAKNFIAGAKSVVSAANAGLASEAGFKGGTIRLSAQSYDQKAGSVFSVTGGDGLIDIWSWRPVELGERVYTTTTPQRKCGQSFAGTFELGDGGTARFSSLRGPQTGLMLLVR